jgi:hypothetical protein
MRDGWEMTDLEMIGKMWKKNKGEKIKDNNAS